MSDEKYVGPIAAAKNVLLTKAALDKKLDKTGGTITGSLKVDGLINAGNSIDVKGDIDAEGYIHSGLAMLAPTIALNNDAEETSVSIDCSGDNAARITSLGSDGKSRYARLSVGTPTGDNDAATKAYVDSKSSVATDSANGLMSAADKVKLDGVEAGANKTAVDSAMSASSTNPVQNKVIKKYVDDHAADDAVLYTAQTLTYDQKFQARKNIGALSRELPVTTGPVSLCPANVTDNNDAVHLTTTKYSGDDFTLTLDCGPENAPVRVKGIRTPTDADTDAAANVEYVKAKISEVSASGGVDVDNALSATSTNPVQNKVITAALTGKADKTALDAKLDKTGGTLTGNLTGKYITGTWLQTTEATDLGRAPGKIAVLDESGWVYYRTPAELKSDIAASASGADYIESQGTTGVWTWRKWASGVAEMWAVFGAESLEMTSQTWGTLYAASWMDNAVNKESRKYPFAFIAEPSVSASPMTENGNFWIASNSENDLGTRLTHAPAYQCVRASSSTLQNPRISYYVVGKYK